MESELSIGFETAAAHRQAVERVILEMRARLADPFSLSEMARIACLSPFHFDRIFHQITGIPAVQFLYALRIEAAKRLLLTSSLSVTDICYEVGYNSNGTFTSRFTQLVGLSPRQFRKLGKRAAGSYFTGVLREALDIFDTPLVTPSLSGRIITQDQSERLVFVGLFPTMIPQGHPSAGSLMTLTHSYKVCQAKDGKHYVFAAAFSRSEEPTAYLLPNSASLLVGVGERPAEVHNGRAHRSVDLMLRPLQISDPPILIALPLLLTEVLIGAGLNKRMAVSLPRPSRQEMSAGGSRSN